MSSNLEAARTQDRRRALEVLRDTLAAALDVAEPNVQAQIAAQYRAALAELAGLPEIGKVNKRDELAARRADRQSAAQAVEPSKPKGRKRGA